MKTRTKVLIAVLTFAILYGVIMIFAYEYLYPYPTGYVDVLERKDNALNYKQVFATKVDDNTTVYISRALSSSAYHFGTIDSSLPKILNNLKCTSTSSVYFPVDSYGYVTTTDSSAASYLYGAISDMNTVKITITFDLGSDSTMVYDMVYEDLTFYCVNFDPKYASYPSTITGYNKDDGITFEYKDSQALVSGQAYNYVGD